MSLSKQVVYQIYPKSFYDTDGDGIGDLKGVIEKLDYVADLGADMIWLNPFYPSPQNDNGYDVSNYTAIDPMFGTMDDFEKLVTEANKRGIDLMLDMVLNHTSTEHEWFQKALAGDKYYQDFYYLRPAKEDGSLPTNWDSKFGGPAWEKFGDTDQYYLHLYDVTQADLNWHNPNVRQALVEVVNFWIAKGVKGFRFDVLNVIGKDQELVDSTGGPGSTQEKRLYTDTPIVHEWIRELNQATFGLAEEFTTVGEMSSTTVENGVKYSNPESDELSMIFQFNHLKVDYEAGEKWTNPPFDFIELKRILDEWQTGMSDENGWNALFLNNHDQPRANSRFGDTENYPFETASILGQSIQFLRGTPYIFQGEEIGMTNPNYTDISDYKDIETINNYKILKEKGLPEDEIIAIIQSKSRDNSRTPMQWNTDKHAGFTKGTPWLKVADNYKEINVSKEQTDGRILPYYRELIRLRKELDVISEGSYRGLLLEHPKVMAYVREYEGQSLLVFSHFYAGDVEVKVPEEFLNKKVEKLIGNGPLESLSEVITLSSYETIAFLIEEE